MSVNFKQSTSQLARTLYYAHGVISEPAYRTIEHMICCTKKIKDFAFQAFASGLLIIWGAAYLLKTMGLRQTSVISGWGLGALIVYEVVRRIVYFCACKNQKQNYIYVKGKVDSVARDNLVIATWNILGFPAGGNYLWGGCIPIRDRFKGIVDAIRKQNADVVVLQECLIDGKLPEAFIAEFQEKYAHFFIHNGPHGSKIESGLFVMSRFFVRSYDFTPFAAQGNGLNRGFATLEIWLSALSEPVAIIGTHMEAVDHPVRAKQLTEIHAAANKLNEASIVVFAGDSNIDMNVPKEVQETKIRDLLVDPYDKQNTCTNAFRSSDPDEKIDQIAEVKRNVESSAFLTKLPFRTTICWSLRFSQRMGKDLFKILSRVDLSFFTLEIISDPL
jgi:endonuclease/exonuclease/phosphatase family metal-dependent hydrolase